MAATITTNQRLIEELQGLGHLETRAIVDAMRSIPRGNFVPEAGSSQAYFNSPLRVPPVHISAPGIYALVLERLGLESGHSFLNVGSGSGWLSTVAALLVGVRGLSHGVEISYETFLFAKERVRNFAHTHPDLQLAPIEFVLGSGCNLPADACKYDRIYVGASCRREQIEFFLNLLTTNEGRLIVPSESSLLLFTKNGSRVTENSLTRTAFASLIDSTVAPVPFNISLTSHQAQKAMFQSIIEKGIDIPTHVRRAFIVVPRGHFVNESMLPDAYQDRPIRDGPLHLSAPHLYCRILDLLELGPGLSFLNIGSGSGWLSTVVGYYTGPISRSTGIEVETANITFSIQRIKSYKELYANTPALPEIDLKCANVFDYPHFQTYDRVYVGAACPRQQIPFFQRFLNPNGILILPSEDSLLKIRYQQGSFIETTILNVRFASLKPSANTPTSSPITTNTLPPPIPIKHSPSPTTSTTPTGTTPTSSTSPGAAHNSPHAVQPDECAVCMENERNAAFAPCGHMVCCYDCATRMKKCPTCRGTIGSVLRLYKS
ncbi:L-isoaspartateD-aspartate O-methyltransferase [Pelomyxa schiedti]|nr:L-isoaspartateD-aspartate O-methyltransferase [Pelomyxa schiedti]